MASNRIEWQTLPLSTLVMESAVKNYRKVRKEIERLAGNVDQFWRETVLKHYDECLREMRVGWEDLMEDAHIYERETAGLATLEKYVNLQGVQSDIQGKEHIDALNTVIKVT